MPGNADFKSSFLFFPGSGEKARGTGRETASAGCPQPSFGNVWFLHPGGDSQRLSDTPEGWGGHEARQRSATPEQQ